MTTPVRLGLRANVRQFALPVARFRWFDQYRYADVEYEGRLTFTRGDLTFELHHARGETDDATWTWIPERKIVAPGDLFIWAAPNAGNPQKVQRYCGEWAVALRCAKLEGSTARLVAGAGVVAGSDPDAEWAETQAKLEPMLRVLVQP